MHGSAAVTQKMLIVNSFEHPPVFHRYATLQAYLPKILYAYLNISFSCAGVRWS